jgi:hypothetical protein
LTSCQTRPNRFLDTHEQSSGHHNQKRSNLKKNVTEDQPNDDNGSWFAVAKKD